MDWIARIWHQDDVTGSGDRLRHIRKTFFRTKRCDHLPFGVQRHAKPALIIGGLRLSEARDPARRRVAISARLSGCFDQFLDHVPWRRLIGVAHAKVDNVGPSIARLLLQAVDLLEHIGRQAANAVKRVHIGSSRLARNAPWPARRSACTSKRVGEKVTEQLA
jgi:hypothetical protein